MNDIIEDENIIPFITSMEWVCVTIGWEQFNIWDNLLIEIVWVDTPKSWKLTEVFDDDNIEIDWEKVNLNQVFVAKNLERTPKWKFLINEKVTNQLEETAKIVNEITT